MNELEKLLAELKSMSSVDKGKHVENNKETWNKISQGDLEALGFESEEEMKSWILANPYSNI